VTKYRMFIEIDKWVILILVGKY